MRLSEKEQQIIKSALLKHFGQDSRIYLFGSRTDDSKRGGDIDLYIETSMKEFNDSEKAKSRARWEIMEQIGEQKIDLIVHLGGRDYKPIEKIAKETGILL